MVVEKVEKEFSYGEPNLGRVKQGEGWGLEYFCTHYNTKYMIFLNEAVFFANSILIFRLIEGAERERGWLTEWQAGRQWRKNNFFFFFFVRNKKKKNKKKGKQNKKQAR